MNGTYTYSLGLGAGGIETSGRTQATARRRMVAALRKMFAGDPTMRDANDLVEESEVYYQPDGGESSRVN